MILTLYDLNHVKIAPLRNFKEASVESELSMGDKTLSFSWSEKETQEIPLEGYIRTDTDEYVVKENSAGSGGYRKITAKLNVEEIEGMIWEVYRTEDATAKEAADYALAGTGWTCVSTVPEDKKRNISLQKATAYAVLEKIVDAYTCEMSFDTLEKTVYIRERIGADKGAYFLKGLNLKEVSDSCDTYDFATRIIPIGADDLDITSVNDGNNFLENYQYSSKVKTVIWEDSNYTDPAALMEDAEYKLAELSKPKRTYQAKVCDLAKMSKKYSVLEYEVGDTVTILDNSTGLREQQRIIKTVEYIGNPEKNTCDISNTMLSFEDMQKQLFAAAECIGNVTTDNGTIKGSTVDSIDVTQIIGLERYISEDVDDMTVTNLYVKKYLGATEAVIGKAEMTKSNVTELEVRDAAHIVSEEVDESHIVTLRADNLLVGVEEVSDLSAVIAKINELDADYATIDFTNVDTASIIQGFLENLMVSQGILAKEMTVGDVTVTNCLTGVHILANDIMAGTLDAGLIRVTNLDCASLTVGQINGTQIAQGTIALVNMDEETSGTIKDASDTAHEAKEDVENMEIGARNFLRNSGTLVWDGYVVTDSILYDENGEILCDENRTIIYAGG
jgi:phage minor structural protein